MCNIRFPPGLDQSAFLARYWQRRPLLIREALPGFAGPLSAEELAGLSCEEEVESRLVLERAGSRPWEVRHGPFSEGSFAALPPERWTLLVQDVDKHVPEVADWLKAFRFVPDWRVDDIMISYAADGGSVGPHVDEYDVFLIQAMGRRRWLIDRSPAFDGPYVPGLDLRILERFEAREEHLLEPGDLIYLPPGVPHWGIAEGPCMTWSVGFRAPSWRELATSWCEWVADRRLAQRRYSDPGLRPQRHSGEILPEVFDEVRHTLYRALTGGSEREFRVWLGESLTEPKPHLEVLPRTAPISVEMLRTELRHGLDLMRNPRTRMAFCAGTADKDLLFVNGMAYDVPAMHRDLLSLLTAESSLDEAQLSGWLDEPECLELLCRLCNEGHYELSD